MRKHDEPWRALTEIPNVGRSIAQNLVSLGIHRTEDLAGKDPHRLYLELCQLTGARQDPCVLDTFMAAVHYASTGERRTWWSFTAERKQRYPKLP